MPEPEPEPENEPGKTASEGDLPTPNRSDKNHSGQNHSDPNHSGQNRTGQSRSGRSLPEGFEERLAENPELRELAEDAISYHEEALSENTRRAYESAWKDFCLFCAEKDFEPLPAAPAAVALYLSFLSKKIDHQTGEVTKEGLSVPTLEQRLSAIRHYHEEAGHESPTSARAVKKVMAGIRRRQRHRSEEAKPLMTYHIKRMVDSLDKKAENYAQKKRERAKTASGAALTSGEKRYLRLLEVRNRALLLVGFAGALRRSEIASLRFEDLQKEPGLGLTLDIRQSKTDQEGEGALIYIRRLESEYDPVQALDEWREAAQIDSGAVFRPVTRGGNVKETPITGRTVNNALQEAVQLAGLSDPEEYSAHSLRAGHATQATKNGVPAEIAMQTTRHESREQFADYVRNEEKAFKDASSGKLGL
jgi:site-specific recombinase XerD